jgi:hypothetical protein
MNIKIAENLKEKRKKKRNNSIIFFLYETGVDEYRRQPCKFGPNRMGLVIPH